jgi:hypothetical protein
MGGPGPAACRARNGRREVRGAVGPAPPPLSACNASHRRGQSGYRCHEPALVRRSGADRSARREPPARSTSSPPASRRSPGTSRSRDRHRRAGRAGTRSTRTGRGAAPDVERASSCPRPTAAATGAAGQAGTRRWSTRSGRPTGPCARWDVGGSALVALLVHGMATPPNGLVDGGARPWPTHLTSAPGGAMDQGSEGGQAGAASRCPAGTGRVRPVRGSPWRGGRQDLGDVRCGRRRDGGVRVRIRSSSWPWRTSGWCGWSAAASIRPKVVGVRGRG